MRISRLRLDGFKSFVDQTELAIDDGLTGVVGPNGCGKSNLLEALRWVMGENRPSAMRGGGMDDVIFAGAASRSARAWAEVALVLDAPDPPVPAAWGGAESVEVVRRIARDVGSAYRVAGREVRARDVQLLFADASTGAHSPALVRQGQIAEMIGAKPKARRRVLEEAAGIAGLHQRRHEALLRLQATEANLGRADDVIEALAQRLAALGRQARQAARYREVAEALRMAEGLALLGRWRAAAAARDAAEGERRERAAGARDAERAAEAAEAARGRAEAAMPALREAAAVADALVARVAARGEALDTEARRAREGAEAAEARAAQIEADAAREARLAHDADATIAALEAEAAELAAAGQGHEPALAEATHAAEAAAEVLRSREVAAQVSAEEMARLSGQHAAAARLLDEAGRRRQAALAAFEAAGRAAAEARAARDAAGKAVAVGAAEAARVREEAGAAEAATVAAEAARAAAQEAEDRARVDRSGAEGAEGALAAEVAALARLVEGAREESAALIDRVRVAEGYEDALGAAMGDDLGAGEGDAVGWTPLPPYYGAPSLPRDAVPLAPQVTAPDLLARRLGLVGIVPAGAGAALQVALAPGQVLVSREGDLWRWDGYRAAAGAVPSAAARHLRQVNRLAALRDELAEAARRAAAAREAHEALAAALAQARAAEGQARAARQDADRAAGEADRTLLRAEAAQAGAGGRLEAAQATLARLEAEAAEAETAWRAAEEARTGLEPIDEARAALDAARAALEGARAEALARRGAADDLRRAGEARERRTARVAADLDGWRARKAEAAARGADLDARRAVARAEAAAARARPAEVARRGEVLAGEAQEAETRRALAGAAWEAGEAALRMGVDAAREAERRASEAREARARAEARLDAATEALDAAEARIAEGTGGTPDALARALGSAAEGEAPHEAVEARATELRRARDAMGPVNLRAEIDAAEARAEHETLAAERAELAQAVAELRAGVAALNREGRQRLLDAFAVVDANFSALFKHLFRGGTARLELIESDDPLEAGLEILCQPPGKKLSHLSLLSGGEQTLTALALIFAVFLANPAPICVLDEVDAPLDDANVTRFCDMLDEMTRRTRTRFLVITHHAVTMARMDRLYGVTMVEPGVSQLVSVDLGRAEALVA